MSKVVDDYIVVMRRALQKYGDKCITFVQVGSFYEVYDTVDASESHHLGVCERVLYIKVVPKKMTSSVDGAPPKPVYAAGFPIESIGRFRAMLLERQFTILVIDQGQDKHVRKLAGVISPGFDEDASHSVSATVLVTNFRAYVCRYDMHINELKLQSVGSPEQTTMTLLNEARRLLHENGHCSEVIVYTDLDESIPESEIVALFPSIALHIRDLRRQLRYIYNEQWQRRCLESCYKRFHTVGDGIFEKLDIAECSAQLVAALILLVTFIREHDERCLDILPIPNTKTGGETSTRLLNGALQTLNIIDDGTSLSLMTMLSRYVYTTMGERVLRERLRAPTNDVLTLEKRYDEISNVQDWIASGNAAETIHLLKKVKDLAQLACRCRKHALRLPDMVRLIESHRNAHRVLETIEQIDLSEPSSDASHALSRLLTVADDAFDPTMTGTNVIRSEVCQKINSIRRDIAEHEARMEAYQKDIDRIVQYNNATTLCDSFLGISTARGKTLQKSGWSVIFMKQGARVNEDAVNETIASLSDLKVDLDRACNEFLSEIMDTFNREYFDRYADEISYHIGKFDMLQAAATAATRKNYTRPRLQTPMDASGVNVTNLRHPIIEHIVDANGLPYVSNDVILSPENSILLYGVNSVGKSSLLKATACAVLMAQSGFFVAASSMILRPYSVIGIHIGGRDDMYRSQSTFVREMEEIRSVLRASETNGGNTLFLADELGNSTEDVSAIKIVSTLLHVLYTRRVSILLATHMFSLLENPYVVGLKGLRNYHLAVHFEEDGTIRFDRTLRKGVPPTREYGCRIAEKIIVDDKEFVRHLNSSRHTTDSRLAQTTRCTYNRSLFAWQCDICGYYPQTRKHVPLDWHHIEGQCDAIGGFVPSGRHVHARVNIMPVCKDCHRKIHAKRIIVHGYEDTADGRHLRYEVLEGD